ncbi:MAG: glutathione S-transferase domain-containing protein, partial [Pseudomonadota bacterium]
HRRAAPRANPDGDTRPEQFQKAMPGIHRHKIETIEGLLENIGDDPELQSAYKAKIAKEAAASDFVSNESAMLEAIALTGDIIAGLETSLKKTGGPWIFGERFTMADLMWGISLIRLQLLGYDSLWTGTQERPLVRAYASRVGELPSLKTSVIDWR